MKNLFDLNKARLANNIKMTYGNYDDIQKSHKAEQVVKYVMQKFEAGELKDDDGNKVTDKGRAQAIAAAKAKSKGTEEVSEKVEDKVEEEADDVDKD